MLDRPRFNWVHLTPGSKLISALRYDPETSIMDVGMIDGKAFRYRDVPAMVFARVVTAKSVGKAFNLYLRNRPSRRLPKPYRQTKKS